MCNTAINIKQQTFMIKNFSRIENPDIHYRRMTYPPEQGTINYEKTKKELMINNPKMKNLFDKRQKEYEKLY